MHPSRQQPALRDAGALDSKAARSFAHSLQVALLMVALVSFGYVGYVSLDRFAFERLQESHLATLLLGAGLEPRKPEADPTLASGARASAATEGLIGRLEIPSADVDTIVAEGVDTTTLRRAVGHLPETAFPGEAGNVALAGHRDTIFRGLKGLALDDRIFLTTADGRFEYSVEKLSIVQPHETDVLEPGPHPSLTLVTCYPFNYVGPAPLRYIIKAREIRTGDGARTEGESKKR